MFELYDKMEVLSGLKQELEAISKLTHLNRDLFKEILIFYPIVGSLNGLLLGAPRLVQKSIFSHSLTRRQKQRRMIAAVPVAAVPFLLGTPFMFIGGGIGLGYGIYQIRNWESILAKAKLWMYRNAMVNCLKNLSDTTMVESILTEFQNHYYLNENAFFHGKEIIGKMNEIIHYVQFHSEIFHEKHLRNFIQFRDAIYNCVNSKNEAARYSHQMDFILNFDSIADQYMLIDRKKISESIDG